MVNKKVEEVEIEQKEPKLNDIFGIEEWDMYRAFAVENGYVINEISPIITEEVSIRQFQVVEKEIHVPTYEEIDQARCEYRKTHIDDKTIARSRKTANGTWTEADEEAYLSLDAEVTAYIEENFPYPEES